MLLELRHIAVERAWAVRLAKTEYVARQVLVEIELLANHGALKSHKLTIMRSH